MLSPAIIGLKCMPELPEVETTVRSLKKSLLGLRFKDAWSDWPKNVRQAGGIDNLKKAIKGKKIIKVWRRAKYIVIDIEGKNSLFIHQKISGHLLYGHWIQKNDKWESAIDGPLKKDPKNQHIRIVFQLSNGYQLALADLRRFGKVVLVNDDIIDELPEIKKLGPEPLEISWPEFKNLFFKKRGRIKQVLMDPRFIAGIGNIYSDEILWFAGIHPMSRVEKLETGDIKKIYRYIKEVLRKAVKLKGSSMDDYRTISGKKGNFQNFQHAYHKIGKRCEKKDGGIITRLKIGGRSAHFCPAHQKLK